MNWWAIKQKVHTSWLITIFCLGFLVGILLAQYLNINYFNGLLLVCLASLSFMICLHNRSAYIIPVMLLAGFLFGLFRNINLQGDLLLIKSLEKQRVSIEARATSDLNESYSGVNYLNARLIAINSKKCDLKVLIRLNSNNAAVTSGDSIFLGSAIINGSNGIDNVISDVEDLKVFKTDSPFASILNLKKQFSENVKRYLPEVHASLGLGFLIGDKGDLPVSLSESLRLVGLTHIIVVSGYNLSIIVRLVRRLFLKISKYLAFITTTMLIIGFILITGLSPSMFRAGLVSFLSLTSWYYGRRFHPFTLIILVMAITVLFNPDYLRGDIGWQLSFAAFFGVMIIAPLLNQYLFGEDGSNLIFQILVEAFSAQIMTMPIILLNFGQLSNISLIANVLILPMVPMVMLLVFLVGVSAYFNAFLGMFFAKLTQLIMDIIFYIVQSLSELPWASSDVSISTYHLVIIYIFTFLFCLYMWRATKYKFRSVNLVE